MPSRRGNTRQIVPRPESYEAILIFPALPCTIRGEACRPKGEARRGDLAFGRGEAILNFSESPCLTLPRENRKYNMQGCLTEWKWLVYHIFWSGCNMETSVSAGGRFYISDIKVADLQMTREWNRIHSRVVPLFLVYLADTTSASIYIHYLVSFFQTTSETVGDDEEG
jgi:hypothetical protein